ISGIALLDGCANPITHAMIPQYVKSEKLVQANEITETVLQLIQTVMWFVGSLFLVMTSPQLIVWIVSLLFILSSILLCFLKKVWEDLLSTPILRKIAIMEIFETIAGTVWIAAILYVFVNEALQVSEEWWGFINGSFFLGLIIGSIYCIKYAYLVERNLGKII